jgi:ABC-type antimicrobial peptide transport system permease subunit
MEGMLSGIRSKGVDKAHMKRLVIKAIIKMCAKSIALTTIIGVVIGIIGYINKWNSSIAYSNAFFVGGCLLIIAGTSSRYAAGQE